MIHTYVQRVPAVLCPLLDLRVHALTLRHQHEPQSLPRCTRVSQYRCISCTASCAALGHGVPASDVTGTWDSRAHRTCTDAGCKRRRIAPARRSLRYASPCVRGPLRPAIQASAGAQASGLGSAGPALQGQQGQRSAQDLVDSVLPQPGQLRALALAATAALLATRVVDGKGAPRARMSAQCHAPAWKETSTSAQGLARLPARLARQAPGYDRRGASG